MKIIHALSMIAISAVGITGCQTTPNTTLPVIQRPNNVYETTGLGKTKAIAKTNAISYANQQCRSKSPIVLTDEYKYNGVLDEGMGRIADQAIGVLGGLIGSKKSIARDDDYEYTITFRCQ